MLTDKNNRNGSEGPVKTASNYEKEKERLRNKAREKKANK